MTQMEQAWQSLMHSKDACSGRHRCRRSSSSSICSRRGQAGQRQPVANQQTFLLRHLQLLQLPVLLLLPAAGYTMLGEHRLLLQVVVLLQEEAGRLAEPPSQPMPSSQSFSHCSL